ncbi:MAG: LemA family protein [Planctomycetota bacterium]|nr:LemA family protein [Planctomycetota bacterium]
MTPLVIILIAVGIVVVLLILFVIAVYNALVRSRNRVRNAWSQIDVQLKRRHDLIPNLIETVKGYAKHERETLDNVIRARQVAIDMSRAGDIGKQIQAENALSQTLRSLFALAEAYPDLKANQNFLALQEELTSTENKISFARQHYNDSVMHYNNQIEMFPSNIIAGMFGFKKGEFFEVAEEAQREPPKVSFT